MATYNTLTGLLSAIANAIRSKTGETGVINAQDFPSKIESISTTPKTQTVEQTLSLAQGEVKSLTFTFNELTTVYGISNFTVRKTDTNAYGNYQDIDGRNQAPRSFIENISNNTVTLKIQGYVDTSSAAIWSVTAIGN